MWEETFERSISQTAGCFETALNNHGDCIDNQAQDYSSAMGDIAPANHTLVY